MQMSYSIQLYIKTILTYKDICQIPFGTTCISIPKSLKLFMITRNLYFQFRASVMGGCYGNKIYGSFNTYIKNLQFGTESRLIQFTKHFKCFQPTICTVCALLLTQKVLTIYTYMYNFIFFVDFYGLINIHQYANELL